MAGYKSTTFDNDLLKLLFNNTTIAGIGDATGLPGSAAAGSLYLALHSADPTSGGTQSSSEVTTAAYTGYTRVAVSRNGTAGFTATGNSINLTSAVSFPAATTGSTGVTATFFSIGSAASGATKILYAGPISPTIPISTGVTPQLTTAAGIVTES